MCFVPSHRRCDSDERSDFPLTVARPYRIYTGFPRRLLQDAAVTRAQARFPGWGNGRTLVLGSCAIAAAGTGEGKTSIALAFARAARDAGYSVAPFKCGPDYLDAQLYGRACGERARNVDLWLDGSEHVAAELQAAQGRAIVIEGMMGLFDGDDEGATSSAHIFSAYDIPTILVLDGWRASQTLAAIALGCSMMQPRVRLVGAVMNRAGGNGHQVAVRRALASVGIPLLASLPYRAAWRLPERHLGLDVSADANLEATISEMSMMLAQQCDLAALFGTPRNVLTVAPKAASGPIIAVANDEALMFTYPQTLDALRAAGAQCVAFSPLRDTALPPGTSGIWLGGGYPELHAEQLAANVTLRHEIADAVASGMPVYAECGGYMYLGRSLRTVSGIFPMCAALNGETRIDEPALTIGYRSVRAASDSPLDVQGKEIRAYEFHYARGTFDDPPAYAGVENPGSKRNQTIASFFHRRFYQGDTATCRFVEARSQFSR